MVKISILLLFAFFQLNSAFATSNVTPTSYSLNFDDVPAGTSLLDPLPWVHTTPYAYAGLYSSGYMVVRKGSGHSSVLDNECGAECNGRGGMLARLPSVAFPGLSYLQFPYDISITRVEFTVIDVHCQTRNSPTSRMYVVAGYGTTSQPTNYVRTLGYVVNSGTAVDRVIIDVPPGKVLFFLEMADPQYTFIDDMVIYKNGMPTNLDLKVDSISIPSSSVTADNKISVSPGSHDVVVSVSGTGFDANENRSTEVSLQVGSDAPIAQTVNLAQVKAAGSGGYAVTFTGVQFTSDQVGALDLIAKVNLQNGALAETSTADNTYTQGMYVLCNVEDSGKTVAYFPQGGSSRWANDDYANQGPKKMKSLGCYTTSFSMLMDFYGIKKSADGFSSIDPGSVNIGLNLIGYYSALGPAYSTYNGYTSSGAVHPIGAVNFARASYASECIAAGGVPSACKAKAAGKISYIGRSNTFSSTDQSELNKQLCAGNPVILKVKSISSPNNPTKGHFVLGKGMAVTATGNLEYLAFDPARQNSLNDPNFNYPISEIRGFRLYKQIADPSMISIHLVGGLNMVVTDPMGNKVGYDPYTGQSYNSVQGTTYSSPESIDAPDSSVSTPLEATFESTAAIDGRYQVQIFGDPNVSSSFRLTRYSFDDIGNINAISDKSGKISAGRSVILTADHTSVKLPSRDASLIINKALFFDSKRKDKAFIFGRVIPEDGRAISRIDKFVTVRIGSFIKSIEAKKMKKIKSKKDTYYVHTEWDRRGLTFEINADSGEFSLYVDNIELDKSQPNLTTNLDIQIDDLRAENVVTFQDKKRRKGDK